MVKNIQKNNMKEIILYRNHYLLNEEEILLLKAEKDREEKIKNKNRKKTRKTRMKKVKRKRKRRRKTKNTINKNTDHFQEVLVPPHEEDLNVKTKIRKDTNKNIKKM